MLKLQCTSSTVILTALHEHAAMSESRLMWCESVRSPGWSDRKLWTVLLSVADER